MSRFFEFAHHLAGGGGTAAPRRWSSRWARGTTVRAWPRRYGATDRVIAADSVRLAGQRVGRVRAGVGPVVGQSRGQCRDDGFSAVYVLTPPGLSLELGAAQLVQPHSSFNQAGPRCRPPTQWTRLCSSPSATPSSTDITCP
ncbi:MAG: hypothetical protein R3A10_19755 [Caldilineaceae bacterium]